MKLRYKDGLNLCNCTFIGGGIDDGMNLENKHVENVIFERCIIMDVNFKYATFVNVEFYDVVFFLTDFSFTKWVNAQFYGVDLKASQFFQATLKDVSFLPDNVLHKTDISAIDFSTAIFDNVMLDNVIFDELTRLPSGYTVNKTSL
ncbi:hypothetical protein BegalDRAFT_3228 [Beggiatoa alba B18LD]|uniref:Low-complexity protein n=1 Tax=Beggiatoa alba B18LD TaxID=395493 RepID=I3CKA6_9GAMM|nr:pentapeptide repeat-containing protein [Beggiatoa alba]EIJ44049.1 hypothetical protein BegalDRAFT_3228 [Beggiatoa alba B18LD]